jgi:hypothetical protein
MGWDMLAYAQRWMVKNESRADGDVDVRVANSSGSCQVWGAAWLSQVGRDSLS